jgi:predicted amidophosphoribosyltransferase
MTCILDLIELDKMNEKHETKPVHTTSVTHWYVCGHCQRKLETIYDFCPICGRKINWSGE